MSDFYQDALARLCLMEKDVFVGTEFEGVVDAEPIASFVQETEPYWANDTVSFSVGLESQSLQVVRYQVLMELVLAKYGSGFESEAEELATKYVPIILQYFGTHRQMRRTQADVAVTYLHPDGILVTGGRIVKKVKSGIGQLMNTIEFDMELPMYQQTDQVIF